MLCLLLGQKRFNCLSFFFLLRYSLVCTVESLSLVYLFSILIYILEDFENASPYFCTFLANCISD